MLRKRLQPISLALVAAMGVVFYAAQAAEVADSEQVSTLLRDVKSQAILLRSDASTVDGYTRAGGSWESHGMALQQTKKHINEAGRLLAKLQDQRKSASPWQATAMDRIDPLLRELASTTETVIKYLKENPKGLFLDEFRDHIEANADMAARLSSLIGDFVDYGSTKQKVEHLTSKLELAKR